MTTPKSPDIETAVELARLRTELHATNSNMSRVASVMEKTHDDINKRLLILEERMMKMVGIFQLATFLGAPAVAGIVVYLARTGS